MDEQPVPRSSLPPVPPPTGRLSQAPRPGIGVPPAVDRLTDSGRHTDLAQDVTVSWRPTSETGRHAAVEPDAGPRPDEDLLDQDADGEPDHALTTTGSHRVLITRPSRRRWIPAGAGVAVLTVVVAVVLSTGFAAGDARTAGSDDAAGTEAVVSTTPAAASTSSEPPMPAIPTLNLLPGTPGVAGAGRTAPTAGTTAPRSTPIARTASPSRPAGQVTGGDPVVADPPAVDTAPISTGSSSSAPDSQSSPTVSETSPAPSSAVETTCAPEPCRP